MRPRRRSVLAAPLVALALVIALALGATPASASTPSAKTLANKVLKLDPRKPADINLFTSNFFNGKLGAYPGGSPMHPASGAERTTSEVRTKLKPFLSKLTGNDTPVANHALDLFDKSSVKARIPDPNLRATFVSLLGTFAAPEVNPFLSHGAFTTIDFGAVADSSSTAESQPAGSQRKIVVNQRYRSEDFRLFLGILAHEILHEDSVDNNTEETLNNAVTGMVNLQILSRTPDAAYLKTELARRANTLALAFFNSRNAGSPNSQIVAPRGTAVYPGGQFHSPDFWTLTQGSETASSPGPSYLKGDLHNILSGSIPAHPSFSFFTAKLFDHLNDKWLSDEGRLQVSVLLQLVSMRTITQKTGLSRSKAISKLHLKPYLDAIK